MARTKLTIAALLVTVLLIGAVGLATASGPNDTELAGAPAQALGDLPAIRVRFDGCIDTVRLNDDGVGRITVDGFPVEITAETDVEGELVPEACVRVEALLQVDTSDGPPSLILVATSVRVRRGDDEPRCLEFYGELVSIEEDEWHVVGGPPFVVIPGETEFEGDRRPGIGDVVKVEICRHPDGYWYAEKVKLLRDRDDDEDEVEFRGRIAQIREAEDRFRQVWKVGRWWVGITGDTVIEGTPRVGALAEIRGHRAPEGAPVDVIATKAEVEDSREHGRRVKLEAAITAVATTTPEAIWEFEGIPVAVDEHTVVIDHRMPAEPGVWGDVEAILRDDNTLYAQRIKTGDEDEREGTVYFDGRFLTADDLEGGQNWVISSVDFFVPTELLPDERLAPGDEVELKAMHDGDTYEVIELDFKRKDR